MQGQIRVPTGLQILLKNVRTHTGGSRPKS
jgi:hypothetical protein